MTRVFITGLAGFMGRALARRLRAEGVEVVGVDLRADLEAGVVAGDTSRPGDWQAAMAGADAVIHTAALVSLRGSERRFWEVNVLGTRNALDGARAAGAERFVHISSVTAFGFEFPDGVDEHHPLRTNGSPYVDTKVTGEQVVLQAHAAGELDCTIIRPGDVYGPEGPQWTILPVEMLRDRRVVLPARGRGIHSPVFIENLVDGIVLAARAPGGRGEVFTLTDGVGVTTRRYFDGYADALGLPRAPAVPNALALPGSALAHWGYRLARRPNELNPHTVAYLSRRGTYSIAKAREVLGFDPRVELEEGMARTTAWCRQAGLLERGVRRETTH